MKYRQIQAHLNGDDKRNTDHELEVLGLVPDEKHGQKHCYGSAERGKKEQSRFSRAVFGIMFRGDLVVNADDD